MKILGTCTDYDYKYNARNSAILPLELYLGEIRDMYTFVHKVHTGTYLS